MLGIGRKVGIAGFLLSVGLACTQLFGDEQNTLAPRQPRPPMGTTAAPAPLEPGAAPVVGICSAGQMRCEGALLQTCSDDLSTWVTVQRCGAAALCQAAPASCLPATCAPDEMTCAGAVLQKCNADRTGWDLFNTCLSPAHCNASSRQCLSDACSPGDRRCDRSQTDQSPTLEVCRDDRSGWDRLDSCVTRELCDQTLTSVGLGGLAVGSDGMLGIQPASDPSTVVQCNLPACAAGETRCEGASLQFCSEGRTGWLTAEECASAALCQSSLGNVSSGGTPQCLAPACATGEHRCAEGGLLQVCSEDRSSFVDKEQCIGAPFCNAALANQGQSGCTDAPCEAGLAQCNGAQIEVCRDDRTGLDPVGAPCESAALCNAQDPANAFCEEPLCRRGATSGDEFRCEGAQLQRCNESLTSYDTIQTCITPALCDASQRLNGCRPPVCAAGEFNCADGFLQVCNADRTGFQNLENCGSQAQCDDNAGRCADPCEPGSTRCNASNGDLERCNDRLTGWQPIADCPNVQLCDAENERCRICVPNEFSCADGQLRQCDAEGRTFARTNIPPECAAAPNGGGGIRACQGNTVVINPCPLGCQQPENRCRECTPGQTQCVGNGQIRTCGNNGFYGAATSCSDGNFCNGTETCANNQCVGGAPPACGGFGCQQGRCNNCNAGQCANGTQFQTCDNGLISTARNCPAGQVCQGGGNCVFNCPALNCNDNNPCTNDTCTAQAGCGRSNVPNGTGCSNGNACDGTETCQNGNCNRGAAPNCSDGNPCTSDTCNPATGCAFPPVANGTNCGDGNACNGTETCQNGFCSNPPDVVCAAPPACRTVSCNTVTGACTPGNAPNGSGCNVNGQAGSCSNGTCVPENPCVTTACNQNVTCASAVTCIPQGGVAQCIPIAAGAGNACRTASGAAGTCSGNGTGAAACIPTPVVVCSAGQQRCNGTTLEVCSGDGTRFVTANACADETTRISCTTGVPTLVPCPGALCRQPFCDSSSGRCSTQLATTCTQGLISNGRCDANSACVPACEIVPCTGGSFCSVSGFCDFVR